MAQQIKLKPGHKFVQLVILTPNKGNGFTLNDLRVVTKKMRDDEEPETYFISNILRPQGDFDHESVHLEIIETAAK